MASQIHSKKTPIKLQNKLTRIRAKALLQAQNSIKSFN